MVLLAMLLSSLLSYAPPTERVLPLAHELFKAHGPEENVETAAFIVRGKDGSLAMHYWPRQFRYRTASWEGPVPEGVIAIIHTHPSTRPEPSPRDYDEARRLQMPFYVVTRGALCVADPRAGVSCIRSVPWVSSLPWKKARPRMLAAVFRAERPY